MMGMPWQYAQASAPYYAMPMIPPSSTDVNSMMRMYAEAAMGPDRTTFCSADQRSNLGAWAKVEEHRKVIVEVIKARLGQEWPYNIKALDILGAMPDEALDGLADDVKKLADAPASQYGSAELKKAAKPVMDKIAARKAKAEEEEAKKKQEAIAAMWGGLWANAPRAPPPVAVMPGWPYPYGQLPPGAAALANIEWTSKAPEGWAPYVVYPYPGQAAQPYCRWP
ncbi:hypothetical protein Q5752_000867 [Cryptotrichosporon argae]